MLHRFLGHSAKCCGLVSGCCFAAIMVVVTVDVVARNLGVTRASWLSELSEYLMMLGTFLGAPWLLHQRGHVNVDLLPRALNSRNAARLDVLVNLAGMAICAVLLWAATSVALDAWARGSMTFKNLSFPEWYLLVPMILCFILCLAEFANRIVAREVAQ